MLGQDVTYYCAHPARSLTSTFAPVSPVPPVPPIPPIFSKFLLAKFGYTDFEAGIGNTVYQLSAALVGVVLGGRVTQPSDLRVVIRGLHVVTAIASTAFGIMCWAGSVYGRYTGAVPLMITVMVLLGGSLMGMLPFLLQQAVHTVAPASENVVSGLIYLVAMSIAASLTAAVSAFAPLTSMCVIGGLVVAELLMFGMLDPQGRVCCRARGGAGGSMGTGGAWAKSDFSR